MTMPVGGIFYIEYTYGKTYGKKRYTLEEWKQLYFDGAKACFDWEKEDDYWVMKLPDGTIVCSVGIDIAPRWSCCFYPLAEWNFIDGEDPSELLDSGKKLALEYGFKILDLKFRVLV